MCNKLNNVESGCNVSWVGLININKPAGWTSRDVVNRVAKLVKPAKAGHAGTLDPLATGVLVLCLGQATRLIENVQQMPKTYRATFLLGQTSDTEDITGQVVELTQPPIPTEAAIRVASNAFLGEIQQRPPAYSAKKIKGKRAYDLARAGETVELAPRPVKIYQLQLLRYEYPTLEMEVTCGSGTYIRSLGRDIAESLGTGAVMSALVRTKIGSFTLENATELSSLNVENLTESIRPALEALPDMPRMKVTETEVADLTAGKWLERSLPDHAEQVAAVDAADRLIAIVIPRGENRCGALRNFASPS